MHFLDGFGPSNAILMRFFKIASALLLRKSEDTAEAGRYLRSIIRLSEQICVQSSRSIQKVRESGVFACFSKFPLPLRAVGHPFFDANALNFPSHAAISSMRIASEPPAADVILMRIQRRCENDKPIALRIVAALALPA